MVDSPESKRSGIRRSLRFTGRVQGVGFRYTAQHLAHGFEVTGLVRNLPDGSVELVAEGDPEVLERFQSAVERAMGDNIKTVRTTNELATGAFSGFRIAY